MNEYVPMLSIWPNFVDTHFVSETCISDTKIKVGSRKPWKIGVGKKIDGYYSVIKKPLKMRLFKNSARNRYFRKNIQRNFIQENGLKNITINESLRIFHKR